MMRQGILATLLAIQCCLLLSIEARAADLVEWQSADSLDRLARSAHKTDFFPLSNHFVSQDNAIFGGPASSAIVLNALRLGKRDGLPKDRASIAKEEMAWLWPGADPFYGKYTPNNVFTDRAKSRLEVLGKPIPIKGVPKSDFGFQLHQLAKLLRSHGLDVALRVVDDNADASEIRRELAENLASEDDYVLVNYSRTALGQPGGGHISPLGAYDEASDSFLLMDVDPNRAPWVWISADDLVAAMRTFDTVENRGYVMIAEGK